MKETRDVKLIVESLIFVSEKAITTSQIKEVLGDVSSAKIEGYIKDLNEEYVRTGRGFRLEEIAGGWQFRTVPEVEPWIKELLKIQRKDRLSSPALETMAIIAYKQPITKAEIEGIRGVNIDGVLSTLTDKQLVRIVGRKEVAGRPFLYGTTTRFLEHFGLANIKDLPEIEGLKERGKNESKTTAGKDQ